MQIITILVEVSRKNKNLGSKTDLLSNIIEQDTGTDFEFNLQTKTKGRFIEIDLPKAIDVRKIKKSLRKENFIVWLVVEPSKNGQSRVTYQRKTKVTNGLKIWDLFLGTQTK